MGVSFCIRKRRKSVDDEEEYDALISMGYGGYMSFRKKVAEFAVGAGMLDKDMLGKTKYDDCPLPLPKWVGLDNWGCFDDVGLKLFLTHCDCEGKWSRDDCRKICKSLKKVHEYAIGTDTMDTVFNVQMVQFIEMFEKRKPIYLI